MQKRAEKQPAAQPAKKLWKTPRITITRLSAAKARKALCTAAPSGAR